MPEIMNVTFDHSEQITPRIRTFWFRPEKPVDYIAGQFTELYLPHAGVDDRGERRWFTLSSSPTEKLVAITTAFAQKEGSSFKCELASLKPGATLKLADPMGDFVLPKDKTIPLIFVAAGLGVTPVRSMVKWLQDTGEQRSIQLLQAASNADELAFQPLFASYAMQYIPMVSDRNGHITEQHILDAVGDDRSLIYISGPEIMVETLIKKLTARGVSPNRLVGDYFPGYPKI